MKKKLNKYTVFFLTFLILGSCRKNFQEEQTAEPAVVDYIRPIPGNNDTIPEGLAQRGKVLIAYADCYTCHKTETRAKGPAFEDIAARYPIQEAYIDMLAHRIIAGGSGAWGNPVMLPHPTLSHEDAKNMVSYILSLKHR